MTAAAAPATPAPAAAPRRLERASVWYVVALVVIGVVASLGLRSAVSGGTTAVSQGGITASIPQAWGVGAGVGSIAFIASNTESPSERYIAQVLSAAGASVTTIANQQGAAKAALLGGYVEVQRREVIVNGVTGLAVDYAYLKEGKGGARPVMILGEELILPTGDKVLDLSYEAPSDTWDAGLDLFHSFAGSARVGA